MSQRTPTDLWDCGVQAHGPRLLERWLPGTQAATGVWHNGTSARGANCRPDVHSVEYDGTQEAARCLVA
jgi:hypothetical protein